MKWYIIHQIRMSETFSKVDFIYKPKLTPSHVNWGLDWRSWLYWLSSIYTVCVQLVYCTVVYPCVRLVGAHRNLCLVISLCKFTYIFLASPLLSSSVNYFAWLLSDNALSTCWWILVCVHIFDTWLIL